MKIKNQDLRELKEDVLDAVKNADDHLSEERSIFVYLSEEKKALWRLTTYKDDVKDFDLLKLMWDCEQPVSFNQSVASITAIENFLKRLKAYHAKQFPSSKG